MRVTLLTPTGDRPEAFALCERWVVRQSRQPDEWVVVDDGVTPTVCTQGQTYVRRRPPPANAPPHELLPANVREAVFGGYVKPGVLLFVEDDDWYSPHHVEAMAEMIESGYDMAGESDGAIYHVGAGLWGRAEPWRWCCALARTAVRAEWFLSLPRYFFEASCVYLDLRMWSSKNYAGRRWLGRPLGDRHSVVGMKGMPGRAGLSAGHNPSCGLYKPDPDGAVLREWVGDDADVYRQYRKATR